MTEAERIAREIVGVIKCHTKTEFVNGKCETEIDRDGMLSVKEAEGLITQALQTQIEENEVLKTRAENMEEDRDAIAKAKMRCEEEISRLKAEIQQGIDVGKSGDKAMDLIMKANDLYASADKRQEEEIVELSFKVEKLEKALKEYGKHDKGCGYKFTREGRMIPEHFVGMKMFNIEGSCVHRQSSFMEDSPPIICNDCTIKSLNKYKSMYERVKFLIEDGVSLTSKDIKEIERQGE